MNKVIQLVREAKLQTQNVPDDASVWAAVSRPKATRQLATHAGKVRKCLYMLGINARNSECEYSTGTVWLSQVLLASATRPLPSRDTILPGMVPNSWLDAEAWPTPSRAPWARWRKPGRRSSRAEGREGILLMVALYLGLILIPNSISVGFQSLIRMDILG